mmetsp:Transcript_12199/g.13904  ORF Transcript_12199/g.13904 Transcript_12199/m.13904 type:complete len:577 (-) Transcript_12199:45-1775(-)
MHSNKPQNCDDIDRSIAENDRTSEDDEDDDDEEIDEDMIFEYTEDLNELGAHPDKVKINALTMIADDFSSSKKSSVKIYDCVERILICSDTNPNRLLPLIYLLDSILKNSSGPQFKALIGIGATSWIPSVYNSLPGDLEKSKLKKVVFLWRDCKIFEGKTLENLLLSLESAEKKVETKEKEKMMNEQQANATLKAVPLSLRAQMQTLLDEMQNEKDELEKVSLERLAMINPTLLQEIQKLAKTTLDESQKKLATSSLSVKGVPVGDAPLTEETTIPPWLIETRSAKELELEKSWQSAMESMGIMKQARDSVQKLHHHMRTAALENHSHDGESKVDSLVSIGLYAAAGATAQHITVMLQSVQERHGQGCTAETANKDKGAYGNYRLGEMYRQYVDSRNFTTEGLKGKNEDIVGILYDTGLPFRSISDGRRFATQLEHSKHLDEIFRKSQIGKTMERTEERGWYQSDKFWSTGESSDNSNGVNAGTSSNNGNKGDTEISSSCVLADETRSKCVMCGIPFEMFFDHDDVGDWMYSNCKEVTAYNDDAAEQESEQLLVHLTCFQGLGSPDYLTMDQVLQA